MFCEIPNNFTIGYACLNQTLRKKHIFSSRTLRLATFNDKGLEYVKSLCMDNLRDLLTILKWNKQHDIYFMRMSSEMFPFASHPEFGYSIEFADSLLKEIGKYAKDNKIRLTMHPGQYDVLSSPNKNIVHNTTMDLNHHCDIMDRMGLDKNSVMIIHGGGVYGNKEKSLKRLASNILKLPKKTRDRLVLENDDASYTIQDLINISEIGKVPLVLDFHHDDINPSTLQASKYFDRVFKVWRERGIKPKVHISNSAPGIDSKSKDISWTVRRKHSDYIYYIQKELLLIKLQIDVMFECKQKELAILKLRKQKNMLKIF